MPPGKTIECTLCEHSIVMNKINSARPWRFALRDTGEKNQAAARWHTPMSCSLVLFCFKIFYASCFFPV